jgi:integrin beta 8
MVKAIRQKLVVAAVCLAIPGVVAAQPPQPGQAGQPGQQGQQGARRQMLEQRLRERTGDLVRRRLQLTDDQMTKLQSTNRQFEQQRMSLIGKEREVRQELRRQLTSGTADQNRVASLLDQAMQLERQRLDVQQSEQRELAKFLTPVQRAKLFGLQNEMRRRAQELRNGQMQRQGPRQGQGPMRPGQRRPGGPGGPPGPDR